MEKCAFLRFTITRWRDRGIGQWGRPGTCSANPQPYFPAFETDTENSYDRNLGELCLAVPLTCFRGRHSDPVKATPRDPLQEWHSMHSCVFREYRAQQKILSNGLSAIWTAIGGLRELYKKNSPGGWKREFTATHNTAHAALGNLSGRSAFFHRRW